MIIAKITARPFCIIDGYVVVQIYQSETVLARAIIMCYTIGVKHYYCLPTIIMCMIIILRQSQLQQAFMSNTEMINILTPV